MVSASYRDQDTTMNNGEDYSEGSWEDMKSKDDIMQCFYDIISSEESTRLSGVSSLVSTISSIQQEYNPNDRRDLSKYASSTIIGNVKITNEKLSPELNYTLRRLVFGLASTRDLTKMGFSLALGELLNELPEIDLSWVFDFIMKTLDVTGKDLSERESHSGRLFALMAIIRSGRIEPNYVISRDPTHQYVYNGNAPESEQIVEAIIEQLIYISRKRPTYIELSYELLISTIELLNESNLPKLWQFIKILVPTKIDEYSPELLSLLYFISIKFKSFDITTLCNGWAHKVIFNESNLVLLKKVYGETTKSHPRVNKIWRLTMTVLLENKPNNASLVDFWKTIVENNLFKTSSNMKKYLGLQLFEILLPIIPATMIKDIFTKNVIYYLNEALRTDSPLHEIGSQVFQGIAKVAEISQDHRLELIYFFSNNYDRLIDRQIPVDIITELSREIDQDSVDKYINFIIDQFYAAEPVAPVAGTAAAVTPATTPDTDESSTETEDNSTNSQRNWSILQLSILLKDSIKRPISFISNIQSSLLHIIEFFYFNAFYLPIEEDNNTATTTKKTNTKTKNNNNSKLGEFEEKLIHRVAEYPITSSIKASCSSKFFSLLEELSVLNIQHLVRREKEGGDKDANVATFADIEGTMVNGDFWASHLCNFQTALLTRTTDKPMLSTLLPMGVKPIDKVMRIITQLQTQPAASRSIQTRGFELLFVHLALQYVTDPIEIAEFVDDIVEAFEELTGAKTPTKKSAKQQADRPSAFMVLLDILISLLDRQSAILKTVVRQIFTIFSDRITLPVFEHIIDIITAPITDIFDQSGDEDELDDEDDDLEIISGDELDEKNDEQENDDDEEQEDDDEDSGDDDDEEEDSEDDGDISIEEESDDEVDPALVAKLKRSLKGHLLLDEEEEEDDGRAPPTDAEAKALDRNLAAIFSHKREKRSSFQDLKSKTLNLKIRLIDLVDIYIKRYADAANSVILDIIPLLIDASISDEPTIANKMVVLFKNRVCSITGLAAAVKPAQAVDLMQRCFDRLVKSKNMTNAQREESPIQFILAGHAIYMAIGVLIKAGKLDNAVVLRRVSELCDKKMLYDKRNIVAITFLAEFTQRYPVLMWEHVGSLMTLVKEGCNEFCMKKVGDILTALIKRLDSHGKDGETVIKYVSVVVNAVAAGIASNVLKSSVISIALAMVTSYLNCTLFYTTIDQIKKSGVDATHIEKVLSDFCKRVPSQAHKESCKRIVRVLQVKSELTVLTKRKRKDNNAYVNEVNVPNEHGNFADQYMLTIENAEREKAADTKIKVANKNKSRPKSKAKEVDEGAMLMDEVTKGDQEKLSEEQAQEEVAAAVAAAAAEKKKMKKEQKQERRDLRKKQIEAGIEPTETKHTKKQKQPLPKDRVNNRKSISKKVLKNQNNDNNNNNNSTEEKIVVKQPSLKKQKK